jgi:hypothetical protein
MFRVKIETVFQIKISKHNATRSRPKNSNYVSQITRFTKELKNASYGYHPCVARIKNPVFLMTEQNNFNN